MKNITIKTKIIFFTIISIVGFVILVFFLNNAISDFDKLRKAQVKIEELKSDMLMLRRNEKDFLLQKNLKYKDKFEKNVQVLDIDSQDLLYLLNIQGLQVSKIKLFERSIDEYKLQFLSLVKQQQIIGLNEEDGLYGSLRNSVHKVQNITKKMKNFTILALVYELRKNEKDFMLRRDIKYVNEYKKHMDALLPHNGIDNYNDLLLYKKDFLKLVNAEIKIGLNRTQGIRGKMRNTVYHTEKLLEDIEKYFDRIMTDAISKIIITSFIITALMILLVILFSFTLLKSILSSINNLQSRLLGFFKHMNENSEKIEFLDESSQDEIGNLAKVINEKIKEVLQKNREKDKAMLQQSRLAQMGEMISMIAHQWRQPLTAISATSGNLTLKAKLEMLDNETAVELGEKISSYSQHLSSTIDDFRDFFKPNKQLVDTTYTELVQNVLSIVADSLDTKNIKLKQELQSEVTFSSYPNELKQVILNLIKNAEDILLEKEIKYPVISIETQDNILRVKDNAGGVPKDIIEKIFNPYFSTKTQKDGTGLGLYMSKTIIEEHCGGELHVYNDENGAVFEIKLPVKKGEKET